MNFRGKEPERILWYDSYHMNEDIIHGALVIFYRGSRGVDRRFLVVTTTRGGNTAFPGGAREGDESAEQNAYREAQEELGLDPALYTLQPTGLANRFTFGVTKTLREGKQASYDIFLTDLSHLADNAINPTPEIKMIQWLTQEEVVRTVTFPELVKLFQEAVQRLPS